MATNEKDILNDTLAEEAQKAFAEINEDNINTDREHGKMTDASLEYGDNPNVDRKLERSGNAELAADGIHNAAHINNTQRGQSSINTVEGNSSMDQLCSAIDRDEAEVIVSDLSNVPGPGYACAECNANELPTHAQTPNAADRSQEQQIS